MLHNHLGSGADPGFFLGGGALVSCLNDNNSTGYRQEKRGRPRSPGNEDLEEDGVKFHKFCEEEIAEFVKP